MIQKTASEIIDLNAEIEMLIMKMMAGQVYDGSDINIEIALIKQDVIVLL